MPVLAEVCAGVRLGAVVRSRVCEFQARRVRGSEQDCSASSEETHVRAQRFAAPLVGFLQHPPRKQQPG